ncbi:MAG: hypothetical protein LAP61_22965 [Acidobacteriia bacterium]|nr:hypothetical protein [Terriglobia bacterium]
MNPSRIALVVILAGWAPMLHAQMGCISQIRPIRPPSAGPNAALLCLCAQNNISCHWQWAAAPAAQPVQTPYAVQAPPAAQAPYPPPVQSDTSIYRTTPPSPTQPMSPLDMAIKAEQVRALRLENQQREQEMNQREIQRSAAPATVLLLPIPAPPIVPPSPSQSRGAVGQGAVEKVDPVTSSWKTGGSWNGRFWRTLDANEKGIFLFAHSDAVRYVTIASTIATDSTPDGYEHFKLLNKVLWPQSLTIGEVLAALDLFYVTPENRPISIPNAVCVIAERSSGADEATVQKNITDLRAEAGRERVQH